MRSVRDWSIRAKWIALGVGSVLITVAVMIAISLWGVGQMTTGANRAVETLALSDLDHTLSGVMRLIETSAAAQEEELDQAHRLMQAELDRAGGLVDGSQAVTWTAVNQYSQETQTVSLAEVRLASDATTLDDVVRRVGGLTGAAVTIFQRMNPAGDMLRVATTVVTAEGKPAVGTFIPATMADGTSNPVLARILQGDTYMGLANVVGSWYVSDYVPLHDASGQVTGMLFVGIPHDAAATLSPAIHPIRVGESGYVFVLSSSGADRGAYIMSKDGTRDGENIWETRDADDQLVIQDIVAAGVALQEGEFGTVRYRWQNPGEASPRWKLTRVAYYEPYNWVIGVGAYEDEIFALSNQMRAQEQEVTLIMLGVGLGLALIAVVVMRWIAAAVAGPIARMAGVARDLARGMVTQTVTHRSGDEVGQLAESFRSMIAYLKAMAQQASAIAAGDLTQTVTPASDDDTLGTAFVQMTDSLNAVIGGMSEQAQALSGASHQLAASAEETGRATNQIAATMQQLARGATDQADGVARTASTVEEVKRAIEGVAQGAQSQAASVNQTSIAIGQLSRVVGDIRQGAEVQAAGLHRAAAAQATLGQAVGQMSQAADQVARETTVAAEAAASGGAIVAQTVAAMQQVRGATEQLSNRVRELGRYSTQIGSIVETIDGIAAQTNLLALNAAIEAARAGEHGKGFAVVADEVRKLAEKSAAATKEIAEMVRSVQRGSTEAVDAMRQTGDDVMAAVQLADQSGVAFKHITTGAQSAAERVASIHAALEAMRAATEDLTHVVAEVTAIADANQGASQAMAQLNAEVATNVENVSAVIEENTAATEQMAASATEVTDSIQTIASVSEENSAAVEEVSASAEEISAQVEEVAASAQSMTDMARALQQAVSQFKLAQESRRSADDAQTVSVSVNRERKYAPQPAR